MGQQGAWAYNHAAFTRTNGSGVSYTPPDGQYISWANSWSEVYRTEGEKHSDQGEGSYLDRPNGLLTRPDVAFLTGALNAHLGLGVSSLLLWRGALLWVVCVYATWIPAVIRDMLKVKGVYLFRIPYDKQGAKEK